MFNEEANLERTYELVTTELNSKGYTDFELIFVNDGSLDDTWNKANAMAENKPGLRVVGYPVNQGRGKALRTGIDAATGDVVVTIDFDLSYDASHISRMIAALEENPQIDAVLASVYMPGGEAVGVPAFRLFISKMGNLVYRNAFSEKIYTSTCVVRAYRRPAIQGLLLASDDKEIHLEIISKLLANGHKLLEIPATLTKRKAGKSKFKFRATSISHLIYFFHERPFALFGLLGLFFGIVAVLASFGILYTRFADNTIWEASFLGRLFSPNFVIIMFLTCLQFMGIGFLGIQNNLLKNELFKIQKQLRDKQD